MTDTPRGNRIHIAFFGLRNAGKSTLVNAVIGQPLAIISDVPGTTTDPVSKAMEILPLGPCLITDTAGLDDVGELGERRVAKSLAVLETADVAVWVGEGFERWRSYFKIPVLEYHRGDSVDELKRKIAALDLGERTPGLLEGLVKHGDRVMCITPIDESAPKGRLILPQQQVIRECLDLGAVCTICQPDDIPSFDCDLAIVDSQAFGKVRGKFAHLTSFSVLFARQKGDLAEYMRGLAALKMLSDGDIVLIAEGCTHHRQCNDIGSVKIPKALHRLTGKALKFAFASGCAFDVGVAKLVVHCGGCMLTRREMLRRIEICRQHHVPIVNYGLLLAVASGMDVNEVLV